MVGWRATQGVVGWRATQGVVGLSGVEEDHEDDSGHDRDRVVLGGYSDCLVVFRTTNPG